MCRTAGWGCIDCKKVLFESMERELVPIRTRAQALREQPQQVEDALADGTRACQVIARETMAEVKDRMGLA
jgi:tryptophanyl-tRNA synthetase